MLTLIPLAGEHIHIYKNKISSRLRDLKFRGRRKLQDPTSNPLKIMQLSTKMLSHPGQVTDEPLTGWPDD